MKFETTILQSGGNTTGIVVPDQVVEALGAGKRPKVVLIAVARKLVVLANAVLRDGKRWQEVQSPP